MLRLRRSVVSAFLVGLLVNYAPNATTAEFVSRASFNFNPGWRLFIGDPTNAALPAFDDSDWKPVTLPRAWNEDSAFKVAIDQHPAGIAWYRKRFKLPPDSHRDWNR